MRRFAFLTGALLALLCPGRARPELIVFEDGRVVKAAGYQLLPDELEVLLPGGGSYRVDLALIERIVEDEVEVAEVVVQELGGPAKVAYDLSYKDDRQPLFGSAYDAIIRAEAKKNDVDASLVSALIRAESNYEPRAVSRKGARGLDHPAVGKHDELRPRGSRAEKGGQSRRRQVREPGHLLGGTSPPAGEFPFGHPPILPRRAARARG